MYIERLREGGREGVRGGKEGGRGGGERGIESGEGRVTIYPLHGGRYGYNFLDGIAQSLDVITPV